MTDPIESSPGAWTRLEFVCTASVDTCIVQVAYQRKQAFAKMCVRLSLAIEHSMSWPMDRFVCEVELRSFAAQRNCQSLFVYLLDIVFHAISYRSVLNGRPFPTRMLTRQRYFTAAMGYVASCSALLGNFGQGLSSSSVLQSSWVDSVLAVSASSNRQPTSLRWR